MKQETPLKTRYLIKLASNIVNGLINIVLVAVVPKALGTVAYGEFSYLFQFFSRLFGFLDSGSSTAFFTKLSAKPDRFNLIGYYTLISLSILSISTLLIYLVNILGFAKDIFPEIDISYIYWGLLFGFLTWWIQVFIKISDAYALTLSIEVIKIVYKIFSMVALILVINYLYLDLTLYFIFNIVTIFLFILAISTIFFKERIFSKNIFNNISFKITTKEFLNYISPLFIVNTLGVGVGFFQIWLLQKYGGSEESGFYGLAYQIGAMSFLFTSAMTQIITREFSKSFGEGDLKEIKRLFLKFAPMLYSIASLFSLFILFQAENLLLIFTDKSFLEAIPVVMIMSLYPIHQTYGQLSSSLFFATERTKLYRDIGLIGQVISLIFSIIFVYYFDLGAVGFAVTMVFSQLIGTNIQLFYNSQYLNISFLYLIKHQIYSVTIFIFISFIASFIAFHSNLATFLTSGLVYIILVGIAVYIYPEILSLTRDDIKRVANRLRK